MRFGLRAGSEVASVSTGITEGIDPIEVAIEIKLLRKMPAAFWRWFPIKWSWRASPFMVRPNNGGLTGGADVSQLDRGVPM